MPQQMHLMQMLIHSASTHTLMSWADPADGQLDGQQDFGYWQHLARTLERGCFDGVFFADSPATHAVYKGSVLPSVKYGASWPNHDPMPLVAVMAATTQHLGIGVTLSTTNPDSVFDFVDPVVPLLQKRGVYRSTCEGRCFRDNLMS